MRNSEQIRSLLSDARLRYEQFLGLCKTEEGLFRLTPKSDVSPYARCFWIYGMHLIQKTEELEGMRESLVKALREDVRRARKRCQEEGGLQKKPYRQLLTFTLSALALLDALEDDPLEELIVEQLPDSVERYLKEFGCLRGVAQSGNQAMFLAIFLIHARDRLKLSVDGEIKLWVDLHLKHMNALGFWGDRSAITHLQFQNGYHQYEIFEYLDIDTEKMEISANAVSLAADKKGHFAPYPGGGGCYDYDAVFMLTPDGGVPNEQVAGLLDITLNTVLREQNEDGGFCESHYIRPRSARHAGMAFRHILAALPNVPMCQERLRYNLSLQRKKHDRIQTHWSDYSRLWSESDLWDSWFRMLAIARIMTAYDPQASKEWGFINFPGIGYHPLLRNEKTT